MGRPNVAGLASASDGRVKAGSTLYPLGVLRAQSSSPPAFSGGMGWDAQLNCPWLPSGVSRTGTSTWVCICKA